MRLVFCFFLILNVVPAFSSQGDPGAARPLEIPHDYIKFMQNRQAYQELIPGSLAPTDNEARVFNQFADRGVHLFLTSDQIKATPLGRTADTLQNTLKTDLDLEGERTRHLFSFQILALQTSAQVKYTGWLDAHILMDFHHQRSQMELTSHIAQNRTLFLTHTNIPDAYSTMLGVRVPF